MQVLTDIAPGARIGNYVLIEKIGAGAFAQVWKARHHERDERIFAIKIPTDPAFRKQLQREGKLPDIHHDNVVPILDSDTRGADVPYIVMPYYAGGTLADLIAQYPSGLPEERVEALLKDILTGLAELHSRGIVNRDIKPSNVLLNEHGRAAIADFGLWSGANGGDFARSMQQSLSMAFTDSRQIAGTIAYMAPEVRDGNPAMPASDVYSVGIMLFEMLVGRRPEGIELPGRTRGGLRNASPWNGLFYWSTRSASERYSNAAALWDASTNEPRPLPAWLEYRPKPSLQDHDEKEKALVPAGSVWRRVLVLGILATAGYFVYHAYQNGVFAPRPGILSYSPTGQTSGYRGSTPTSGVILIKVGINWSKPIDEIPPHSNVSFLDNGHIITVKTRNGQMSSNAGGKRITLPDVPWPPGYQIKAEGVPFGQDDVEISLFWQK